MIVTNINLVTCGDCGETFAHTLGVNELTCPHCGFVEDICHFPDLYYPPDRADSIIKLTQPRYDIRK